MFVTGFEASHCFSALAGFGEEIERMRWRGWWASVEELHWFRGESVRGGVAFVQSARLNLQESSAALVAPFNFGMRRITDQWRTASQSKA
jgi:hypothetical protein